MRACNLVLATQSGFVANTVAAPAHAAAAMFTKCVRLCSARSHCRACSGDAGFRAARCAEPDFAKTAFIPS